MKKIKRPITVAETFALMELVEFLLVQAEEALACVLIGPDIAVPRSEFDKATDMYVGVSEALKVPNEREE
jgi:hypothetical protein